MEHQERLQLAQTLCDRFVARYGPDVVLGGVYGSTARGLDIASSDLEMLFITHDGCKAEGRQILYRGMPVYYSVVKQGEFEKSLTSPSLDGVFTWPFWMGVLTVLKVLHGEESQVETWLEMGKAVPDVKFKQALEKELPGLVLESYGRILSCRERANLDDLYCAVLEVLFEIRDALCLLNGSWVTHDYFEGLKDSFEFPKTPDRYTELATGLWRARAFDEVLPMAEELVGNFRKLLAAEGLAFEDFNEVSDIEM